MFIPKLASFCISTLIFNSFLLPPLNVTSETPSILDKFSIISNSTKSPKVVISPILESFVLIKTNLDIGLSSELDVLTTGFEASSGNPLIVEILFNNLIVALSIFSPILYVKVILPEPYLLSDSIFSTPDKELIDLSNLVIISLSTSSGEAPGQDTRT